MIRHKFRSELSTALAFWNSKMHHVLILEFWEVQKNAMTSTKMFGIAWRLSAWSDSLGLARIMEAWELQNAMMSTKMLGSAWRRSALLGLAGVGDAGEW